jgi:TPP-dependent indolepyruvate ferredoxin oxidoreductase alpha subunit
LLATAVGAWLARKIVTPKDHERAALLDRIALGAASLVVSMYPGKPFAELLLMVVQRISTAAGVPTGNATAIENAAATALAQLGRGAGANN